MSTPHLAPAPRTLVEIFGSRLSIAFDNVILYRQLHEANTQLEDRVAQRTRALMQANRRLSAQWLRLQRGVYLVGPLETPAQGAQELDGRLDPGGAPPLPDPAGRDPAVEPAAQRRP